MNLIARLFMSPTPPRTEDDEWWERHNDPRRIEAQHLLEEIVRSHMTLDEVRDLWQQANTLVGKRAPIDQAEFLLYGYAEGYRDALEGTGRDAA